MGARTALGRGSMLALAVSLLGWPLVAFCAGKAPADPVESPLVFTYLDQRQVAHPAAPLVTNAAPGVRSLWLSPPPSVVAASIVITLAMEPGERFYGLGERFDGVEVTGVVAEMWTEDRNLRPDRLTSYSPVPFLLSNRGYGLLVDTIAPSTFDVGASVPGVVRIEVDATNVRVAVIEGPDPATVLERRARLIGLPPLPPVWGFGVWKNLIGGADRVEAEVEWLRRAGVAIDAVWIYDAVDDVSGFGWPWPMYGPVRPGRYADLAGLVDRLHDKGVRVLGYLNPLVSADTPWFGDAYRRGFLVEGTQGQPILWGKRRWAHIDLTDPAVRAWFQGRITHALGVLGFDGAMADFGEDAPVDGVYTDGRPGALVHNDYPVMYARAVREAAQTAKPHATVFFARSGYLGSEAFTTGGFTGDQERSWDLRVGYPSVVSALLSGSLSGRPYWGPDIGGFVIPAEVEREQELWIRWVQLGALSPTMRDILGSTNRRYPVGWDTDADTVSVFRAYTRLHQALVPYLYGHASLAHTRGLPILRPLFVDYPAEPAAWDLDDQYLLGPDLLVAPVLEPGQTQRRLYLPAGTWYHYWTGQAASGPGWVTVDAPLEHIPLFVRAGATPGLPDPATLWEPPAPTAP